MLAARPATLTRRPAPLTARHLCAGLWTCQPGEHLGGPVNRHEQPRLIADDLGEAALRLVPGQPNGREPGKLEALTAID